MRKLYALVTAVLALLIAAPVSAAAAAVAAPLGSLESAVTNPLNSTVDRRAGLTGQVVGDRVDREVVAVEDLHPRAQIGIVLVLVRPFETR